MRDFSNILQTLLEQQLAVEKGKLETEKIRLQALLEEKVHIWSARYCHLLYRNMADTWKYCENCFEPRCPLRCAALCCIVLRCVVLRFAALRCAALRYVVCVINLSKAALEVMLNENMLG